MQRLSQLLFPAVIALAALVITPAAVFAGVPLNCSFDTSAISSDPLKATVTLSCPGYAGIDAQVDDASLIGPATVHFYSGPDLEWTKTVAVPAAGVYKLSITITFNSLAGPVTGTSTCCSVTVYDVAPTPTPVITPAPATPRPVITPRPATPRPVITPRPATPRPVITPRPTVSTDTPAPTDTPSAWPSESPPPSPAPSESPNPSASASATPEPTASPSVSNAPAVGTTTIGGGSDFEPLLVAGLVALWLLAALLALVLLRRKRRKTAPQADQPAP